MNDFLSALGLVFVIEGVLYALMPAKMKSIVVQVLSMPDSMLRMTGLITALIGIVVVWLVRG